MPPKAPKNGVSVVAIIAWVVVALICIQGYFLIQKKMAKPPVVKPVVVKVVPKPVKPKPQVKPGVTPRLTIVIDDWGYNSYHCKNLEAINAPLGVAILPNLPYTRAVIDCAKAAGKDPMLHLPIEPHVYREAYSSDYILKTDMAQAAVKKLLVKIFSEMPGVVGVNNHIGSKGTEDPVLMTTVLTEIKRRKLFFVDSLTSEQSVCGEVARKLKMRIAVRDVFLDNRNERQYIERQFMIAERLAIKNGHALIIGHDRALTLQIIKEQVDKLTQEGFEFIPVKEYISLYDDTRN
jgi:polysaccharide deacetylase 2 family uncharacterized protein YibQ